MNTRNTYFRHSPLALLVAFCAINAAANPNIPPPPQQKPLMITGATLHTVSGEPIANGRMLVDRGRIVAIGPAASVPDQPGATVVALTGKHIYPGFVAANTTIGLVEVQSVRATVDTTETGAINPNSRALVAVNADSELIPVARANGVLAALSAPRAGATTLIAGTSALIQLDGWNWEDMGLVREVGLHITLPGMRMNPALFPTLSAARVEEMARFTTQRLKALEEAFETASAYARSRKVDATLTIDQRWEAMRPVFEAGAAQRTVYVHAEELPQLRYALNFAERFGLRMVLVGGQDAGHIAPLLAAKKIPVIVGGLHRLPLRRGDDTDGPFTLPARLAAAGVPFAIARSGSTFDAATERSLPFEAATAVGNGLPAKEALKAITLYPAEILGVADKLGSLDKGKLASFIVTDGDPLDIRTNVEKIYIQGREIPLEDKHTRLNRKYEEKYRQLGVGAK